MEVGDAPTQPTHVVPVLVHVSPIPVYVSPILVHVSPILVYVSPILARPSVSVVGREGGVGRRDSPGATEPLHPLQPRALISFGTVPCFHVGQCSAFCFGHPPSPAILRYPPLCPANPSLAPWPAHFRPSPRTPPSSTPPPPQGAIIFIAGGVLRISHSSLSAASASREGGALALLYNVSASLSTVLIQNCTARLGGGALYLADGAAAELSYCTVEGCAAGASGGGIQMSSDATARLVRCQITECTAESGGGVAVNGASLFLFNCSISGCSASEDGGGMLVAAATGVAILADSILSDNQAVRDGGCISLRGGSLTMEDSELRRCATLQDGGGMVIQAGGTAVLRRATVEACEVRTVRRG